VTKLHLKEGTTEKREMPKVALSLREENSSLGFIEAVLQ